MSDIAKSRPKDYYKKFKQGSLDAYSKMSPEQRKALADKRKATLLKNGYTITKETRKKLSQAQKGRIVTEETRQKIKKTMTGQKYSKERIEACRLGRLKAKQNKLKQIQLKLNEEGT